MTSKEALNICINQSKWKTAQQLKKLQRLEDVEEELGIDLLILKKVLDHGQEKYVYFKDRDNKIHKCDRAKINIHICVDVLDEPVGSGYFCQENLFLDDYGKTWALTKEELENGK